MILKQVIKYDNAPALEATWVIREQLPDTQVPASPALYDAEGKEVQAAVEAHTVPGEILETVVKCQAYSADQMDMLAADLGDDAPTYQALMDEIAAQYVPPPAPAKQPRQFTSLEFLDLFTEAEQLTVAEASLQSAQVKLWYDRLLAASYITLSDPRVEAGLSSLVEAGLLTDDRRNEIVDVMR